jgi:hypothetical protein
VEKPGFKVCLSKFSLQCYTEGEEEWHCPECVLSESKNNSLRFERDDVHWGAIFSTQVNPLVLPIDDSFPLAVMNGAEYRREIAPRDDVAVAIAPRTPQHASGRVVIATTRAPQRGLSDQSARFAIAAPLMGGTSQHDPGHLSSPLEMLLVLDAKTGEEVSRMNAHLSGLAFCPRTYGVSGRGRVTIAALVCDDAHAYVALRREYQTEAGLYKLISCGPYSSWIQW